MLGNASDALLNGLCCFPGHFHTFHNLFHLLHRFPIRNFLISTLIHWLRSILTLFQGLCRPLGGTGGLLFVDDEIVLDFAQFRHVKAEENGSPVPLEAPDALTALLVEVGRQLRFGEGHPFAQLLGLGFGRVGVLVEVSGYEVFAPLAAAALVFAGLQHQLPRGDERHHGLRRRQLLLLSLPETGRLFFPLAFVGLQDIPPRRLQPLL